MKVKTRYLLKWPYQWPNKACLKQLPGVEQTLKHKHLQCKHTYVHQRVLDTPRQPIVSLPPENIEETKKKIPAMSTTYIMH